MEKKKRKLFRDLGCGDVFVVENKDDLYNGGGGAEIASKGLVGCQKAVGLCLGDGGRQWARRIWRKRMWVVLMVDLAMCMILIRVWLCICQGFRCIEVVVPCLSVALLGRATASVAVAQALASVPPHQRLNLPSSSEELNSIYGIKHHGEVVDELEKEFYEEEFDPVLHVLEQIPSEKDELEYNEKNATLRLVQLDKIAERLSRHVMERLVLTGLLAMWVDTGGGRFESASVDEHWFFQGSSGFNSLEVAMEAVGCLLVASSTSTSIAATVVGKDTAEDFALATEHQPAEPAAFLAFASDHLQTYWRTLHAQACFPWSFVKSLQLVASWDFGYHSGWNSESKH
ncbi:hypothetical protein Droror1_Dr00016309 [Drosera rotundifolia]